MRTPNINAVLKMTRNYLDGKMDRIDHELDFPYEIEKRYQKMRREDETGLSVGRSEYRIDIGVVDPKKPDQYILGIMLDGSSYGAARTTRDREIAQISVLNGLGWSILRVWCMDWWDNSEKELQRIFRKLEDIQTGVEKVKSEQGPSTSPEKPTRLQGNASNNIHVQKKPAPVKTAPTYRATTVPVRSLSADEFIELRNERNIRSKVELVIKTEAPLSLSLLTKRVVQSYGITRAGSRIQGHFNTILRKMDLRVTTQEDVVFYWSKDQDPEDYVGFRICGDGENRRDVRDVPVQEVANAVYTVLYEQGSMGQEDLLRETAKKLGYTRLGGNVLSVLALGIRYAQNQGGITVGSNGTFVLSNGGMARAEAIIQNF